MAQLREAAALRADVGASLREAVALCGMTIESCGEITRDTWTKAVQAKKNFALAGGQHFVAPREFSPCAVASPGQWLSPCQPCHAMYEASRTSRTQETYGARRIASPKPLKRFSAWRTLHAASAPVATIVSARPKLNAPTITKPSVTFFNCKQTSSTVNAAGHGINPPVTPNKMICGVVTARPPKRFAMSCACASSCAS